jgi:hypothetical protein
LPTKDLGELFRTDAKGDEHEVVVGGWETAFGLDPKKARWFAVTLDKVAAPWLFERGHGSRTIATSELIGTLIGVHLFTDKPDPGRGPTKGVMKCQGGTDNQGNTFVVSRLLTTKFPLAAVLMQLSQMLAERDLWLDLNWIPREDNTEADDLTNGEYGKFDPELRVELDWATIPFQVLADILVEARAFTDELDNYRTTAVKVPLAGFKKKRKRTLWG